MSQADIGATHTSLVSEFASFNTPGVVDGRVHTIAVDGDNVFVGGNFTQIHDPLSDEIINQPYLFAYSKSTGNILRDFDPVLNLEVRALETTGQGTGIFVGGVFNLVNGVSIGRGLVKLDMNGDRDTSFSARPDKLVQALVRLDNTLYVAGNFTRIGNTPVENLAAIDATTGALLPDINLDFDGVISTDRTNGVQGIHDMDITSDGKIMVIYGNFSIIDGISRHRLAVIELENQARVSTWNTDIFDPQCHPLWPIQLRGVDIAPDNSYFVTATSGARSNLNPACDTIMRFDFEDLTDVDVQPTWVNYTGGDTVYEVVSTDHAVYIGGHFRWLNNFNSVNANSGGPGHNERFGLAALDPLNGLTILDWRSDRNPRGVGTWALIAEPEGLYIGDDTDFLNGTEHKKLKFLPLSNDAIVRPVAPTLPTNLLTNKAQGVSGLDSSAFDGNTINSPVAVSTSDFVGSTAAVSVGGQIFYANDLGQVRTTVLSNGIPGSTSNVNLFGLTEENWSLSQLGGMFFDYELSRVYYTVQGDSQLYYRAFSPDSAYFGDVELAADQQSDIAWADVTSMDVIGGYLYFTRNDNNLYRAVIDGVVPVAGTTEVVSGPAIDGRSWDNTMLVFAGNGEATDFGNDTSAELVFESSGDSAGQGRFRRFEFPVTAGEPLLLTLEWLDPDANLRLFVRDANDVPVASDATNSGSPIFLEVPAGVGGTYIASVLVSEGSTPYTLKVEPQEEQPAPLADFEFSANGSTTDGRWQVFRFDVEAGDLVEARVIWDNTDGDLNVFLRDETNSQVARDTDGNGSPAFTSGVATTSGTWSVGVAVKSGDIDYSVLVDTVSEEAPVTPEETPEVTNVALNGVASQSSTAYNGDASRAIDGNTDGRYGARSVTHTAISDQPSWQVQLSQASVLETVVLYNRTDDCCTQRLTNFTVTVLNKNGQVVFSRDFDAAPDPSISIDVGGVSGSIVQVQLRESGILSLAEVQVMGYAE